MSGATALMGLLVALGGAVGALARYLTDRAIQARHDSVFPWGTFIVNVTGSFLLGLLAAGATTGAVGDGVMAGLGVGLCGALTTYSTFGYETIRLIEDGSSFYAVLNTVFSIGAGLAAAAGGAAIALALWE
jgi:fluoride exporter